MVCMANQENEDDSQLLEVGVVEFIGMFTSI